MEVFTMRDFNQLLTYCHSLRNDKSGRAFYNSAYMDAFKRIENYTGHNHNGHFQQLFYAVFDFLTENRDLIDEVTSPPFEINEYEYFFEQWCDFINDTSNSTGEYDMESLVKNLPSKCGGVRQGGGGWSPTLKIMFPAVARYLTD